MSPHIDPTADLYATLGVTPEASAADIKKAYRKLAVQFHPDSTGGDKAKEARFKEISRAYEVLGDKRKRAQYDAMRAGAHRFTGGGFGGAWDLGDLFSQFFAEGADGSGAGQRGGRSGFSYRSARGPFGDVDIFTSERAGPGGQGRARSRPERRRERKVAASDGSALVQRGHDIHSDARLALDQAILGAVVEVPTLTGTAKVKVPPGTSSGVKLRLRGKGAPDGDGGRGDHFVTIHIDVPRALDGESKRLLAQLMDRVRGKVT